MFELYDELGAREAREQAEVESWTDDRDPIDRYGTPEHEAWLIEQEEDDERWSAYTPSTYGF